VLPHGGEGWAFIRFAPQGFDTCGGGLEEWKRDEGCRRAVGGLEEWKKEEGWRSGRRRRAGRCVVR